MEKISLSIEKKIYTKLNSFFQPLGYENPEYWFRFVQNNPSAVNNSSFYFEFNCFKNKYEIDIPVGAYVFDLKNYAQIIRFTKIENVIDEYINDLKKNGVNTSNIQRSTILIPKKKILELDTVPILEIENRYYLEDELDEFIEKLISQITEVILPYSNQFSDFHFLDKIVNSSFNNYEPLTWADYGADSLKKMIIARLASNPDFEVVSSTIKNEFLLETQNKDKERAQNWRVALNLFDEMYEKIRVM